MYLPHSALVSAHDHTQSRDVKSSAHVDCMFSLDLTSAKSKAIGVQFPVNLIGDPAYLLKAPNKALLINT